MVPLTIYFAFSVITPDLLMVCSLIYYLYFLFSPNILIRYLTEYFVVYSLSLAYLSKSFALPFFLIHFFLINALYYFNDPSRRENTVKNLLLGILVFFLISGVWIGLISDKEGQFTYGTAENSTTIWWGQTLKDGAAPSRWRIFEVESWSPF